MTNEELKNKILDDIQFIKDNERKLSISLADKQLEDTDDSKMKFVFNNFQIQDFSSIMLNAQDIGDLLTLKNVFSSYRASIEAYMALSTDQRFTNFLINNNKTYDLLQSLQTLQNMKHKQELDKSNVENKITEINTPENISIQIINDLSERIKNLETKPDAIVTLLKKTLGDAEYSSRNAKDFADKIESSYSDTSNYVEKIKNELDDIMVKSNETLNHNISMVLTEQLQDKATKLKEEALKKLGNISWKPLKILGFYGAIEIALVVKGPFIILCQSGKIPNTQGHRNENRNRCRAICS